MNRWIQETIWNFLCMCGIINFVKYHEWFDILEKEFSMYRCWKRSLSTYKQVLYLLLMLVPFSLFSSSPVSTGGRNLNFYVIKVARSSAAMPQTTLIVIQIVCRRLWGAALNLGAPQFILDVSVDKLHNLIAWIFKRT